MRIEQGSTHEAVRRHNLSVVLRQLHLGGDLSRSELAVRTELNRSTIKALVHQLGGLGLVAEGPSDLRGTPGRPSPMVGVQRKRLAVLAVEIAVDSVAVATVGLGGHVHDRRRVERPDDRSEPAEIVGMVRALAAELIRPDRPIIGIGVAIVGIVRGDDGFVHVAPNLGWTAVPFGDVVARGLRPLVNSDDAPVFVANEGDLGVLAEHTRGAARGYDDVLYVSGEVGIGGGAIVGGQRLTGASGYAVEVGHLPVNPQGSRCGCGGRGCWETEAGQRRLLHLAGVPDSDAGPAAFAGVVAAARAGEQRARQAVEEVGRWLGIGLTGLINVFNPERVLLGGMYARAFDILEPVVVNVLRERALTPSPAEIVPAALGSDAALIGAAELALAPLLEHPDTGLNGRVSLTDQPTG
ncbi:ROK family transcriptional regulator [Phytoactinopolyspora alkaliphila]|uniref:ROK family transcriptional regulator n=1 Tax=Phytoactinopolyspora alkaliphila TaxID=1783498 RepID=A0A6N9YRE8_9ACTN|nr:ROK family transcriptional regulator [Phytoactinopolyspora alkaliphila]NED97636.1 ROK family transcriptional regulator [Phytoactinopolyspora alkaliphila]